MTSRERVIRTLRHEPVDRAPREIWLLYGILMFRADELREMRSRFPEDFAGPDARYGMSGRENGVEGAIGSYTDSWGCVWHAAEPGVCGEVEMSPLADLSALSTYKMPWELLKDADFSNVNRSCAETDRFVKCGTQTRPFERLQFLHGTEATLIDLAYGTREIFTLIDMLHDFFCTELKMWAKTDIDGISWMDDWGSQTSLLISPDMWRTVFKPLYKDYVDIIHESGKYAFFHSDGFIEAIYPDLIEIGVDAINSQLFCMDIEGLAEKYAGKVTFWGEIDRQGILPFGTPEDVRKAVRRVRAALDHGKGGVIAECEWGNIVSSENMAAVFDEWNQPLSGGQQV